MSNGRRSLRLFLLILLVASPAPRTRLAAAQAQEPPSGTSVLSLLKDAPSGGPPIRVGLTADKRKITITSNGPFQITDASTGRPAWKERYREDVLVTTHGAHPSEARVWRVQVASLERKEDAEILATRLGERMGEETSVAFSPDRGSWRVRVGAASGREGVLPALQELRAMGYADAWVTDEPAPSGAAWLRLVDSDYATEALSITKVRVEPSGEGLLAVDGKRYRGSLEILVDASAGLRVVNVLPLEEYLRGVVPAELGPEVWPEIEAQKAQAVAARTYAVRNLGRFAEEGFDLCDSPRCQVYEGKGGEHPLSDAAIRSTSGMIAVYKGEPINALFTSTCGGHTEDGGEIFPEEAAPYLKGVPCYPDEETLGRQGAIVEGFAASDAGGPAEEVHAAALLVAAGIAGAEQLAASWRRKEISESEARELIDRTGERLGLQGKIAEGRTPATRLGFPMALADRLGWRERADVLVEPGDLPALVPLPDLGVLPPEDLRLAAVLASRGLLPRAEGGLLRPGAPQSRGEALVLLARAAAVYGAPEMVEGSLARAGSRTLRLRKGDQEIRLASPRAMALFIDLGAGPMPHPRIALYPGDRVRCSTGPDGEARYLLVLPSRKGLSDDRYSPTYGWEVSMTASDITKALGSRFELGTLRDLVPERRGVSGRVVALRVIGERGEALITGFNVRSLLGLKESLFALDRQKDPDGTLRRVIFSGKGWGHGVGLCQVGAFGMAARGAGFHEILRHYYTGIDLSKVY